MSKTINGRMRTNSAREAYVEQLSHNKNRKRKSFTRLHSFDDSDIAYRSTPGYLKQLMNTSTLSNGNSARTLTRTHSASEMTPRTLGNPKYKAQEDYYDEVQSLKKELKFFKDDNSNLRARIRRLEEDNVRKRKEIDDFYDTNKDGDTRRSLTGPSTPTSNVVMNLKQRLFKLETQLKYRETTIDEMKNDPRWTKSTELEIQNRALFNELEKQKFERLNFIRHDYMAAIDDEKTKDVRKLETEKHELKMENENLKKKLHESGKSGKYTDRSEDLKEVCRKYEDEIEQMKDDLKQMRREREKYREKLENTNEDLQEIKRERDEYRQKFHRLNPERDGHTKFNQTGRSSPALKHDDERFNKRPQSSTLRRGSNSSDEYSKRDSRPSTPTRKWNEPYNAHSSMTSKKSSQNLRRNQWTSDDEYRVERFRKKHAATIIQRGWRKHHKSTRTSSMYKTKQDSFDKRHTKIGGMVSPRGSQQKLGSKIDNFGSGPIKNRPVAANPSNESALKTVQAALRGSINRTELDKTSRIQKTQHNESDDEDIHATPSRYSSGIKRESHLNHSKQDFADYGGLRNDKVGSNSRLPTSNRDSTSKLRRSPSPPNDNYRPFSPHITGGGGSKQNLLVDRNKFDSANRIDRELPTKVQRPHSPPADNYRSSSPHNMDSKQSLPNDKNKFGPSYRLDGELPTKVQRPTSPPADNYRSSSPRNMGSKQSLPNDKNKFGYANRLDRELPTKVQRPTSPPADNYRSSSPRNMGSKQSLPNDKDKFGPSYRLDGELPTKVQRPTSPPTDNYRPSSPRSMGSKQSLPNDKNKFGSANRLDRELPTKVQRPPSPPADNYRSSSPRNMDSKQSLPNDKNKFGSANRLDRELPTKVQRPPSPPADNYRSSSPRNMDSKQSLPNDKNKFGYANRLDRELPTKVQRPHSPPADNYRSSSPHNMGSKQSLPNDKNKFGSANRLDRELPTKVQRPTSPPADNYRSSSPHNMGSKQSLPNDKNKFGPSYRLDGELPTKVQRPSSPAHDQQLARQSNVSLRKSPTNSKQSLKHSYNDDDDVEGF